MQSFDLRTALEAWIFRDRHERHPMEAWQPVTGLVLIIGCLVWSVRNSHDGGVMAWVAGFLLVWGVYVLLGYPLRRLVVIARIVIVHLRAPAMDEVVHLHDHGYRHLLDGDLLRRADWRKLKRAVIGTDRIGIVCVAESERCEDHYLYLHRRGFQREDQWHELVSFLRKQPQCAVSKP